MAAISNNEQASWRVFGRRLLYKLSGQKFIGFMCGVLAIIGLLVLSHYFKDIPVSLYLKAMGSVVILASLLMGVKLIQNSLNKVIDYKNGRNNNGREEIVDENLGVPKDEGQF